MKSLGFASAAMSIFLAMAVASRAEPLTVGSLGEPHRLELRGAATFTPEQIRKELFRDCEVLLAAHPLAPRGELAPIIQQRLLAGYLRAGFHDAHVVVSLDEQNQRVLASIDEGPRYTTASLRIAGASQNLAGELREQLTQRRPPQEAVRTQFIQRGDKRELRWLDQAGNPLDLAPPVWTTGQPAAIDDAARKQLHDDIQQAFAECGYPFAQFDLALLPNAAARTIDLVVEVGHQGAPAIVDEIEIVGAEKNSRPEILAFLEIKPGELITRRRRIDLEHRLWESGRFRDQRVVLIPPQGDTPAKLRLELKEYRHAPPLGTSFSREEAALLKMRTWLAHAFQEGRAEFTLQGTVQGMQFAAVISPRQGALLTVGQSTGDAGSQSLFAALVAEDEAGIYAPGGKFRLSSQISRAQLTGQAMISLQDKADKPFVFFFSLGYRSLDEEEKAAPLNITLTATPVMCVAAAHEQNARTSWQEHVLTVASDKLFLRIDSRDGRVLEFKAINRDNPSQSMSLGFVQGEFARRRALLTEAARATPNRFDSSRPFSSLLSGLLHEDLLQVFAQWAAGEEQTAPNAAEFRKVRLLRRLAERDVFRPIDDLLAQHSPEKAAEFDIPFNPANPAGANPMIGQFAVAMGLPAAEALFPRESWPWTLCRETALTLANRPSFLGAELNRMYTSPETGPLSCLATAALLKLAGISRADVFASRGMAELNTEDFLRDCTPFLDDSGLVGKCLHRAAEILRTLDEPEIRDLSRNLLKEDGPILEAAVRELQRDRDAPLEQAIPRALAAAWTGGLRSRVESALESYLPDDTFRIGVKP